MSRRSCGLLESWAEDWIQSARHAGADPVTEDSVARTVATPFPSRRDDYSLLDGAGLRLMECLRLRVQDVDFSRKEIHVRDGKGAKDRITMLPESLKAPLQ